MLNTLKLLVNRFSPKREIEHKLVVPESSQQKHHEEKLVTAPSQQIQLSATSSIDINEIRQRVNDDLHASDVTARQRDRELMDKWFNRGELTNSGSFRIAEFERRMDEIPSYDDNFIEALPAQEDMLMAFAKPEFDLFEEEKISLSGVFLRVNPNEDFDEQYSVPLLPMYKTNDVIMLDEAPSSIEDFNLNFSVDDESSGVFPSLKSLVKEISCDDSTLEETLQDLIAVPKSMIPAPVPAFIQVPSAAVEDGKVNRIDPSALFEEWISDDVFDAAIPLTSTVEAPLTVAEVIPCEVASTDSMEIVAAEIVAADEQIERTSSETVSARATAKSNVKLVVKSSNEEYWSQSDRLTRFGRRKTSASCSSTRLKALTQIA